MKRARLRKWAKWSCTLAAVPAVGAAVFARFYDFRYIIVAADRQTSCIVGLGNGIAWAAALSGVGPNETTRGRLNPATKWSWGLASDAPGSIWRGGVCCNRSLAGTQLGVSVIYPVLLTAVPAAILWRVDRRRIGPHACKDCGYDRRGLAADAKCPECGTVPAQ